LEELIDRNALKIALLNRTEEDLEILLNFILWKIRDPKTMSIVIYVFNMIVDFYFIMYGKNQKIDNLFDKILESINEEVEFEKELKEIDSKIDTVINLNKYSY
jgi:hypothetical protein